MNPLFEDIISDDQAKSTSGGRRERGSEIR
jgi:hypothetical protein